MNYFLVKTEPHEYSISDLKKDGKTVWTGVKNPQAMSFLRSMKVGDHVFIYHSGDKTVAGEAIVEKEGNEPTLAFWKQFTAPLVTLTDIKGNVDFSDFKLVRQSRLSVMPVPEKFVRWLSSR